MTIARFSFCFNSKKYNRLIVEIYIYYSKRKNSRNLQISINRLPMPAKYKYYWFIKRKICISEILFELIISVCSIIIIDYQHNWAHNNYRDITTFYFILKVAFYQWIVWYCTFYNIYITILWSLCTEVFIKGNYHCYSFNGKYNKSVMQKVQNK